jgi:hypothetical protein
MTLAQVRVTARSSAAAGADRDPGPWQITCAIPGRAPRAYPLAVLAHGKLAHPAAAGSAVTADAITRTVAALVEGSAVVADVEALGAHLFAALLAPAWPDVVAAFAAAPPDLLEIALDLEAAPALAALPWELMVGPDGWLARAVKLGERLVVCALTRRAQLGTAAPPPPVQPLRYLFVIGTAIGDEIRAGAECLGLLRQLGPEVQDRVLERASLAELGTTIAEFDPHVVHVICHGRIRAGKNVALLELCDAKGPVMVAGGELAKKVVWTDSAGRRRTPAMVILSTCSSGDRMLPDSGTGIARALVAEGVPLVIGMGAAIHDQACRLFTLELGQALVRRTPLLAAASHGRSAALCSRTVPPERFDWGLIQIVIGGDGDAGLVFGPATGATTHEKVITWLERSGLEINLPGPEPTCPPLCAAEGALRSFYRLLAGQKAGLVIRAQPPGKDVKVGRRRVVSELAAVAIRAGHAPVLVMDRWDYPNTPLQLAQQLEAAFDAAWRRHDLGPPTSNAVGALAAEQLAAETRAAEQRAAGQLAARERAAGPLAVDAPAKLDRAAKVLGDALAADCTALRTAMKSAHGGGQVVLFLHDLHAYGDAITLVLRLLTSRGKDLLAIAPTVVSWKETPPTERSLDVLPRASERAELLKRAVEQGTGYLEQVFLAPLMPKEATTVPLAARLALQRVLLHPFRRSPDDAGKRWLLDVRGESAASQAAVVLLAQAAQNCSPGQFADDDFWHGLARALTIDRLMPQPRALTEADDDTVLRDGGPR